MTLDPPLLTHTFMDLARELAAVPGVSVAAERIDELCRECDKRLRDDEVYEFVTQEILGTQQRTERLYPNPPGSDDEDE